MNLLTVVTWLAKIGQIISVAASVACGSNPAVASVLWRRSDIMSSEKSKCATWHVEKMEDTYSIVTWYPNSYAYLAVDSIQVLAVIPARTSFEMSRCRSWESRSVFWKELC